MKSIRHLILILFLSLTLLPSKAQTIQNREIETRVYPLTLSMTTTVTILEEGMSPKAAYVNLGEVTASIDILSDTRYLLAKLRKKAQAMGANAVMEIEVYKETVNMGVSLVDAVLLAPGETLEDREKTFRMMKATAIRYVENIKYDSTLLKTERFFLIGKDSSLHADIEANYGVENRTVELSFASEKAEKTYDRYISPYAQFHIFKQEKNADITRNSLGLLTKKRFTKFGGSFMYKRMNLTYGETHALKLIKINHFFESFGMPKTVEKIRYQYGKNDSLASGRKVYGMNKKILITETWQYDEQGRVVAKHYHEGKEKSAFMFCELVYITAQEWQVFIAKHTIQP